MQLMSTSLCFLLWRYVRIMTKYFHCFLNRVRQRSFKTSSFPRSSEWSFQISCGILASPSKVGGCCGVVWPWMHNHTDWKIIDVMKVAHVAYRGHYFWNTANYCRHVFSSPKSIQASVTLLENLHIILEKNVQPELLNNEILPMLQVCK